MTIVEGSGARQEELRRLYAAFSAAPETVDPAWRSFFHALAPSAVDWLEDTNSSASASSVGGPPTATLAGTRDSIRALMLIRAFRVRGNLQANLDPLGLAPVTPHPELDPATYGFTPADYDRPIFIDYVLGLEWATLREIMRILEETYAGTIGVQFMHIQDPDRKAWIQRRIEYKDAGPDFTDLGKRTILERLTDAETFERYLARRFTGTKRFGLEGGESMVPAIEQIIKRGGALGLKEILLAMAHRGRLNMLANVLNKPLEAIFAEFRGAPALPPGIDASGDVKYHLGTSADRTMGDVTMHLSLTANPSHLEAVNPVVVGKVRAKQSMLPKQAARRQVAGVTLHGDAAFAGQGLVSETLGLSQLEGYNSGGTIHFIINNQIGFTTNPVHYRPGPWCSDVALMVQTPIFHVNGDDPEAVVYAARVATEYRQQFQSDVVLDMICYRRFGHNEGDEPAFTQPLMYQRIDEHPTTREIYARKMVEEGVVTTAEADGMVTACQERLEQAYSASEAYVPNKADWLEGAWEGFVGEAGPGSRRGKTGVDLGRLRDIGRRASTPPEGFEVHSKIARQLQRRIANLEKGEDIDWATGEMLAIGSLLMEGVPVRMSGQDCGRGTFSQRHAVLVDQRNETRVVPLNNVAQNQSDFEIVDSPLAEASVLGFEYGYSLAAPKTLVIWEAQFGDFANGAQVIIDQFISSGQSKWLRMSGLTMMLPHGYEGQGPEHSSARVERFLQLAADDNMQVVNCTTPANLFHVLRRQMRRKFRRSLIIFTPKSLLRHKRAVSNLAAFGPDSSFHRVLGQDNGPDPADVRRTVFCSGKVYFDLLAAWEQRDSQTRHGIQLVRIEQYYPFPLESVMEVLWESPQAEVVWCQEEPANMGAWSYIYPLLHDAMERAQMVGRPAFVGRAPAASPATGLYASHASEQRDLVNRALTLPPTAD